MTRFTNGKRIVEIDMADSNNNVSFEEDFFTVGLLDFDENAEAYIVKDIDYIIDNAINTVKDGEPVCVEIIENGKKTRYYETEIYEWGV